jgi:hypothetical protein
MAIFFASLRSGACLLCALAVVASKNNVETVPIAEQVFNPAAGLLKPACRARQSLGIGDNPGHERWHELAALKLVHEISADVAGSENSRANLFHEILYTNRTETVPRPSKDA